jgi:hypothetical protein
MATATLDTINNTLIGDRKTQSEHTIALRTISRAIMEQLKMDKGAKYDKLESSAEKNKLKGGGAGGDGGKMGKVLDFKFGFKGIAAAIAVFAGGFALGIMDFYKRIIAPFKKLTKLIMKFRIGRLLLLPFTLTVKTFKLIGKGLTSFSTLMGKGLKSFTKVTKTAGTAVVSFSKIGKLFQGLGSGGKVIGDFLKNILSRIGNISKTISSIIPGLSKGMKVVSFLGRLFGRLFMPILVIVGAIKGFMEGYEEGGIMGGIIGGLTGIFDTIIGWPVNMLMKAVGWLLKKLGFDEAAAGVEGFDVTAMFKDMLTGVVEWFQLLVSDFPAAMGKLFRTVLGVYKTIGGLLFSPVAMLIDWIFDKLGFNSDDPDAPKFSFKDFLFGPEGVVTKIFDWFKSLFSWTAIKKKIGELLPDNKIGNWGRDLLGIGKDSKKGVGDAAVEAKLSVEGKAVSDLMNSREQSGAMYSNVGLANVGNTNNSTSQAIVMPDAPPYDGYDAKMLTAKRSN